MMLTEIEEMQGKGKQQREKHYLRLALDYSRPHIIKRLLDNPKAAPAAAMAIEYVFTTPQLLEDFARRLVEGDFCMTFEQYVRRENARKQAFEEAQAQAAKLREEQENHLLKTEPDKPMVGAVEELPKKNPSWEMHDRYHRLYHRPPRRRRYRLVC